VTGSVLRYRRDVGAGSTLAVFLKMGYAWLK
jgi:hypothetical protein